RAGRGSAGVRAARIHRGDRLRPFRSVPPARANQAIRRQARPCLGRRRRLRRRRHQEQYLRSRMAAALGPRPSLSRGRSRPMVRSPRSAREDQSGAARPHRRARTATAALRHHGWTGGDAYSLLAHAGPLIATDIMRPPSLDAIDIKILAALQRDGRSTIQKLAAKVGLSPRPCLERVRRLEAARIITGYQAQIALEKLSKPITVFAEIALESNGRHEHFERRIAAIEEIVECWEVSGAFDYVARVVCPDIAGYEALTAALIDDPRLGISRIVSLIALRAVRPFAGYPT